MCNVHSDGTCPCVLQGKTLDLTQLDQNDAAFRLVRAAPIERVLKGVKVWGWEGGRWEWEGRGGRWEWSAAGDVKWLTDTL